MTPPSPGPGMGGGSPRHVSGERESSLADPHGGPAATVHEQLSMGEVFLDWEKISYTILEKVVFFILSGFSLLCGSMSKHLKNAPSLRQFFFLK
jgi:hypothetical protein